MKKLSVILICVFAVLCFSCKKDTANENFGQIRLAMFIVKVSDNFESDPFLGEADNACKTFSNIYSVPYKIFAVNSDSINDFNNSLNLAVSEKYNTFVMVGYQFAKKLVLSAGQYPQFKFIGIDFGYEDIKAAADGSGLTGYHIPKNVYCCSFRESVAGFLAGYAAVKEGYRHFGFVGGRPFPPVIRYGLGFAQGIDEAANELNITDKVILEYAYSKSFISTENISAVVHDWINDGVQVIFPCGGEIWTSVCDIAVNFDGVRIIGVDTDQTPVINNYRSDLCLTSAVKNIGKSIMTSLQAVQRGEFDSDFGGKAATMGLVSSVHLADNYVLLPLQSWSMKNFTEDDYHHVIEKIQTNQIAISDSIDEIRTFSIGLKVYPNIK